MSELVATAMALAEGVLEEMVREGGPLADTGVCGIKIDMDSTKESKMGKSSLLERILPIIIIPLAGFLQVYVLTHKYSLFHWALSKRKKEDLYRKATLSRLCFKLFLGFCLFLRLVPNYFFNTLIIETNRYDLIKILPTESRYPVYTS
ncbi:hypothetical protein ACFLTO_05570 [Chloroflexota bacterium]